MLRALLILALIHPVFAQSEDQPPAEATPSTPSDTAEGFQWKPALLESGFFLVLQHSSRMAQAKTRRELGGPFWSDYFESASNIHTWNDSNSILTNYFGHPWMARSPDTFRSLMTRVDETWNSMLPPGSTGRAG